MCLFIETIRIENGVIQNLDYHNERLNNTRFHFWQHSRVLNLSDYIHPQLEEGVIKCRVVYGESIEEVAYAPYLMRSVYSLRVVESDTIDYPHKSTDRENLNQLFAQRGTADDVLIVKQGLLTDTSIANIALYDGSRWYTPQHPLLKGTRRASLLSSQQVSERDIPLTSLSDYSELALFNAMIEFGKLLIPIHQLEVKME